MQLLNENFYNLRWIDYDNERPWKDYVQLDMFKKYTMGVVLPRDEADEFWFSDWSGSVHLGTDTYQVESAFLNDMKAHPTNVGRYILLNEPLSNLYNKEIY